MPVAESNDRTSRSSPLKLGLWLLFATVLGTYFAAITPAEDRPAAANGNTSRVAPPKQSVAAATGALTASDQRVFAWFDSLGYPNLARKKLVRIREPRQRDEIQRFQFGFLLTEDDRGSGVFTQELEFETIHKMDPDDREDSDFRRPRVEAKLPDLEQEVRQVLKELRAPPARNTIDDDLHLFIGRQPGKRIQMLVLARGCAANGLPALAHELLAEACRISDFESGPIANGDDLLVALKDELSAREMQGIVSALSSPRCSRPKLRGWFQKFIKHHPESKQLDQAKEYIRILELMIKEDEARAKAAHKPFDTQTAEEQIEDLIYQLRDQNGHQVSNPGRLDIFNDSRDGTALAGSRRGSPASRLVALGYDAVPQLLKHADDSRLTRSAPWARRTSFTPGGPISVGECSLRILSRVAGQDSFTLTEARNWWAELQKQDEQTRLIEATVSGRLIAPWAARHLLLKHPGVALDAILKGLAVTSHGTVAAELIDLITNSPDPRVLPVLRSELNKKKTLIVMLAAARALHRRKQPEGVAAMQALWPAEMSYDGQQEELLLFLLTCGRPEAIETLGANWQDQWVNTRLLTLSKLGTSARTLVIDSARYGPQVTPPAAELIFSKESLAAVEKLLLSALDDAEICHGGTGTWKGKPFREPRVADLAAQILADTFPKTYSFDISQRIGIRNRQRNLFRNLSRARNGRAAVAIRRPQPIAAVNREQLDGLLRRYLDAGEEQERDSVGGIFEELGLGTVPTLVASLAKLPANHPARARLTQLTARIGSIVNEVDETDLPDKTPESILRRVRELQGHPLHYRHVIDLAFESAVELYDTRGEVDLFVDRDDDGGGFHVSLVSRAVREPMITNEESRQWAMSARVEINGECTLQSQQGIAFEFAKARGTYPDLSKAIRRALMSPANTPVRIHIFLGR